MAAGEKSHDQPLAGETVGILAGWGRYPVAVAAATVVIGLLFLPETSRLDIDR